MTYEIMLKDGVYTIGERSAGEWRDLNADDKPCHSIPELGGFIIELCRDGVIDEPTRDTLLKDACARAGV